MKKVYGFLFLALIVASGIAFVERDARIRRGRATTDRSVFRVVIGGGAARQPDAAAAPAPPIAPDDGTTSPQASRTALRREEQRSPSGVAPELPDEYRYTVRSGDTLGDILIAHLGSASGAVVERVVRHNKLRDANQLRAGDVVMIPVAHYDKLVADGRQSIADLAARCFGRRDRVAALFLANRSLPLDAASIPPRGTVIYVPR